jgi:dUTP pyrophosphatase
MEVRFTLDENIVNARLPTTATQYSAGLDFYSSIDIVIPGFGRSAVPTGVTVSWDFTDAYLQLLSRSGLFKNQGISCEGGVIDFDFNLPISVLLQNHSPDPYEIKVGDRICQGIFLWKVPIASYTQISSKGEAVASYDPTIATVRSAGLGSTGR